MDGNGWDQVGTANWRVEDGPIMADKSTAPPEPRAKLAAAVAIVNRPETAGRWGLALVGCGQHDERSGVAAFSTQSTSP